MTADDGSDQDESDTQSWNLYSYVRNNAVSFTDPDGHDCISTSNASSSGITVSVSSGTCDGISGGHFVDGTVDMSHNRLRVSRRAGRWGDR